MEAFPRGAWERSSLSPFPFTQRLTTAALLSEERLHLASSVKVNSGALGRLFLWVYEATNGHSASARYRPLWDSNRLKRSARRKNSGGVADSGTGAR